ncbi:MAG: phosphoribosylaminoimidazolesuccinocarboxamide synthase [Gammaproteobacteria bacterium]|nr:MAG: phosphoribosylaminoimidazolesuccinocarboxamide synthase [Gammaproteobacteria bacterium]
MPDTNIAITETNLTHLPLLHRGKVRDIYSIDNEHLLIVATDRLSAFDVILPTPIPGKGAILASIANFWFKRCEKIIANHCSTMDLREVLTDEREYQTLRHHAVIVKKMNNLPVEAIVRGYIAGSGWKDYRENGTLCGIKLPGGLRQAEKLPQNVFTPSTKAAVGDHDENVTFDEVVKIVGRQMAEQMRDVALLIYEQAAEYARSRGIIIADTKFEFGTNKAGDLVLIDEVLTPDSSRFWSAQDYRVGTSPASYDKQIIRDYLETLDWDKTAPGPELPQEIVDKALAKYREVQRKLLD